MSEAAAAEIAHVYRWDLDKTYLRTDFDTWRGLLRAAWEKASAKVNVAGSAALMRELKALPGARVALISGSPRQMRKTLEEKFRLDRVVVDEFTLKPNVENLLRGRFRAIRDQVRLTAAQPLSASLFVGLPDVTAITVNGSRLQGLTLRPEEAVPRLLSRLAESGNALVRLEVDRGSLEEVFLALTRTPERTKEDVR